MRKDNFYKILCGLLILILIILLMILISPYAYPSVPSLNDFATFANILVAIGTIFLAFVTYRSVIASEKQIEISNRLLDLQELSFSKEQMVDILKNTVLPFSEDFIEEIRLIRAGNISDDYRIIKQFAKSRDFKILDFDYFNRSAEKNYSDIWSWVAVISPDYEEFAAIRTLLETRNSQLLKCGKSIGMLKLLFQGHDNDLNQVINKHSNIEKIPKYEDANSEEDFNYSVTFHAEEDLSLSLSEWKRLIISLMIYDVFSSIKSDANQINSDLILTYSQIRSEYLNLYPGEEIERLKKEIIIETEELLRIDNDLLSKFKNIVKVYTWKYRIAFEDLRK